MKTLFEAISETLDGGNKIKSYNESTELNRDIVDDMKSKLKASIKAHFSMDATVNSRFYGKKNLADFTVVVGKGLVIGYVIVSDKGSRISGGKGIFNKRFISSDLAMGSNKYHDDFMKDVERILS